MKAPTAPADDHELPVSTPAAQGMNPIRLAEVEAISARHSNLYGLLVARNGCIVLEHYHRNKTPATQNHIRSITKSIVSALVGIAIDRGIIESVHARVSDYLPEFEPRDADARKKQITIEHLLTMTAGFQWDETIQDKEWFSSATRAAAYDALERSLAHEPGTTFNYDSPAADLLTVMLTRAARQNAQTFAVEHLFAPLGITHVVWEQDPAGYYRGSAGISMRPRDLAKFGQLYLQHGTWNRKQVLSREWIAQSTIARVIVNDYLSYGRLWWVKQTESIHRFSGLGYGGQHLIIAPQQQLVIVANYRWRVPFDVALQQRTDFTNQIFTKIIEAAS
ncbi:MAG TPA: serine hydrolase [Roseiflexaceae bacterium]|nr:serine hydrolase [Roseiflexaceae bacterium]